MADDTAQIVASTPTSETEVEILRGLIRSSTVLRDDERAYWLGLLPQMNEAQLLQLKGILEGQNEQMKGIDEKYDQKLQEVGEKTLQRWDGEKARSERVKREDEEKAHTDQAHDKADALLGEW